MGKQQVIRDLASFCANVRRGCPKCRALPHGDFCSTHRFVIRKVYLAHAKQGYIAPKQRAKR